MNMYIVTLKIILRMLTEEAVFSLSLILSLFPTFSNKMFVSLKLYYICFNVAALAVIVY